MSRCALLLLALAACGPPERPGIPPRHLVLVTVEGLRADRTSAWMHHRPTTSIPASAEDLAAGRAFGFDDLAADGVLFEQAFAPQGEPAEALRAVFAGDRGLASSSQAPDLAARLRAEGFETHAWVHASHPLPEGLLEGFDRTEQLPSDLDVVRAVLPFYKQRDWGDGGRVFLWVHLSGTTFPFEPGRAVPDFHEMESGGSVRIVDCAALYAQGPVPEDLEPGSGAAPDPGAPAGPSTLQRVGALYDGEVHELALHLWTLVGFFAFETKSEAPLEDAVIALCGTGGIELDRPGLPWGLRGTPWDSGLRVPLFVRHRDSMTGRRILAEPVDLADLAPTLLEWFGCTPLPAGRDGRSLLALTDSYRTRPFERRPAVARTAAVEAVDLPAAWTARTAKERLVLWDDGRAELFDRLRDPREERPLDAGDPRIHERVESLRAAVRSAAGAAGGDAP
jgi:hypothetical protein